MLQPLLLNGCGILICTVPNVRRLLNLEAELKHQLFDRRRIKHLVLDDIDLIVGRFSSELKVVMESFCRLDSNGNTDVQVCILDCLTFWGFSSFPFLPDRSDISRVASEVATILQVGNEPDPLYWSFYRSSCLRSVRTSIEIYSLRPKGRPSSRLALLIFVYWQIFHQFQFFHSRNTRTELHGKPHHRSVQSVGRSAEPGYSTQESLNHTGILSR